MNWNELPSPLWVLGTDTGVGKTFVSAAIARAWAAEGPVTYRKPFQTGVSGPDDPAGDASAVRGIRISTESHIVLREPLSPMAAAELEGLPIDLDAAHAWCLRPSEGRLLLEGVGGVMVPLTEDRHFLAWASGMNLPCVLVARGGLGTLNHTLLSAEALMLRGWRIAMVVVNPGADQSHGAAEGNAAILRKFLPMSVRVLD